MAVGENDETAMCSAVSWWVTRARKTNVWLIWYAHLKICLLCIRVRGVCEHRWWHAAATITTNMQKDGASISNHISWSYSKWTTDLCPMGVITVSHKTDRKILENRDANSLILNCEKLWFFWWGVLNHKEVLICRTKIFSVSCINVFDQD